MFRQFLSHFFELARPVIVWPREQWIGLALAAVIAAALYALRHTKPRAISLAGLLRFIVPRSIYAHKSSIVDYKFFLSLIVVQPLLATVLVAASAASVTTSLSRVLARLVGEAPVASPPAAAARVAYVVLVMLAADFGYFVFHYLAHKSATLWEFHKVHHAAEVLNPLTTYRNHPVDMIVQQLFIGLAVAPVNAIASHINTGPSGGERLLMLSLVVYCLTATAHLRHTHVWLSYGAIGNRVLSSPAQHQIHHSCELRHLDTNFGRTFSLWDWAFGTLYSPTEHEAFALGLRGAEHKEYATVHACYLLPFAKAWRLWTQRRDATASPLAAAYTDRDADAAGSPSISSRPSHEDSVSVEPAV